VVRGDIALDGDDAKDAARMVAWGWTDGVPASWAMADAGGGIAIARLDTGQMVSRLNADGRNGRNLRGVVRMVVDPSEG